MCIDKDVYNWSENTIQNKPHANSFFLPLFFQVVVSLSTFQQQKKKFYNTKSKHYPTMKMEKISRFVSKH